jgi:RND superfamily putative drug exporter
MVLVPATMAMLGDANWWVPRWLDRILPHLDIEGTSVPPVAERPRVHRPVRTGVDGVSRPRPLHAHEPEDRVKS